MAGERSSSEDFELTESSLMLSLSKSSSLTTLVGSFLDSEVNPIFLEESLLLWTTNLDEPYLLPNAAIYSKSEPAELSSQFVLLAKGTSPRLKPVVPHGC